MAKREKFTNIGQSTLGGDINDSVTTLSVASASSFPADGNFRILIGSEIMLVTGVSGTTFTVVRGREGTTAASHTTGDSVTLVLTADSVVRFLKDNIPLAGATELPPQNSLTDSTGATIDSTDLTWVNQDSSTVTDLSNGNISMVTPGNAGLHLLVKSAPTPPWVFTASVIAGNHTLDTNWCGLCVRESGTGKIIIAFVRGSNDSGYEGVDQIGVAYWSDPDTVVSNPGNATAFNTVGRNAQWIRISDNNTNLICEFSNDGINWTQFYSASRTALLTGGVDQIGIFVGCEAAAAYKTSLIVTHWSET